MAVQPFVTYTKFLVNVMNGVTNLAVANPIVTLHSGSYTPGDDTHETWADVSSTELSTGAGYTAGGQSLANAAVTQSGGTVKFDADDIVWSSFSATARYAILTMPAGASLASSDKLIGYWDLTGSGTFTGGGGDLTLTVDAAGISTIARA